MPPSILTKFLPNNQEKKDYFLALEICREKIKTAACEIREGEVEVLATAISNFSGSWDEATTAADEAISQVEAKFPPEIEVNKVVLGLPTEYTSEGKIETEKLSNIRTLLGKLSLTPLGFVEIPLAVINFLQRQEGGPQTLILVRAGEQLDVSLVRIGKITNTASAPRTDNIALDLEKAIASFTGVEILPSRILVFDGHDLENVKQSLMNHPWVTRASFLHFPKIETAPEDLDIKSVAFAGASEIAQVEEMVGEEKAETAETKEEIPAQSNDFGFVKDEDILEKQPVQRAENLPSVPPPPFSQEERPVGPTTKKFNFPKIGLALPLSKLSNLFVKLKQGIGGRIPRSNKIALVGVFVVLAILILGGGAMAASWYFPTAKVNLLLKPQTLEQPMELILNSKATSINEANKEIPAFTVEVDEKETKKATTTGKKTVGEPAKGEVSIYNKTTNSKTLKQGTTILSSNNLKFTLDSDVTIASASESVGSLTFGRQNAKVTASAIGPEGNLGVGQDFHFADFPTTSYSARNDVAFSGGTSREVSVVSKADQEKLLSSATTELTESAKKDLQGKLGAGEKIIEQTISGAVATKKFDKDVNDEAGEVSLDLSMHFTALSFHDNDLLSLLEKNIAPSVPSGFEFKRENVTTQIGEFTKKKDGTLNVTVDFSVNLLPNVNTEEIKKNLLGKSLSEADTYLRSLGNIAGYEINFGRRLPFGKNLPRLKQNISIETDVGK